MKRRHLLLGSLFFAVPAMLAAAPPPKTSPKADVLESLVRRADTVFRGKTSAAVMSMQVKTKTYTRSYKIVSWDDTRGTERTLIKILGPASFRGFGTLKIGDQLKLYDPKTNHIQVVGTSMLGGSWMGSHFSNDDLVKETRLARDYNIALAKKWKAPAPVGGEATYYRIAMSPKPTAPVAWGRIDYELWENATAIVPVSATYYRKSEDKVAVRKMAFTDVTKMSNRYVPAKMKVTVADKPGEYTSITYKKIKFDVNIPDAKFTEQALRR
jgi:hypothetical protein